MLYGPTSSATVRVRPRSAHFDEEYVSAISPGASACCWASVGGSSATIRPVQECVGGRFRENVFVYQAVMQRLPRRLERLHQDGAGLRR
jgi:hypothetical protein